MKKIILPFLLLIIYTSIAYALPAFPGAEGQGKFTIGGRAGKVIKVINLNDSGPGSLREAVTATGPRIVVFDVSGNINLTSLLYINNPYLTIAGQTSPGGIAISGKQFNVATHDVIIRHMRFRSGGHEYTGNNSDGDSFSLWGPYWNGGTPVYNIMIDHCSFTWGTDETVSVTGGATATTIQNSLIAQGLKYAKGSSDHSKGLFVSGKFKYDVGVSLYRNYIAHNTDRNPLMYNPPLNEAKSAPNGNSYIVDATNNVIFNWKGGLRPSGGGNGRVIWLANYAKEGPNSNRQDFIFQGESTGDTEELFHLRGNIGTARAPSDPEWLVSKGWTTTPLSQGFQHNIRWPVVTTLPYQTMTDALASQIVSQVGATIPIRDTVDAKIVNSFDAGTSLTISTVSYPNDWPTYATPAPATDSDNDGMPDNWETSHGLNNNTNDSALDANGDGYTNIEEYLNALANDPPIATNPPAPQNMRQTIQ